MLAIFFVLLGGWPLAMFLFRREWVLLMRRTAWLQRSKYVQAQEQSACTSAYTLLCPGNSYAVRRAAPTHFFHIHTASWHSTPIRTKNDNSHQAACLTKPPAPSQIIILSKHLFIPNKIPTFAADNCIKSGNVCPPTGQQS